MITSLNSQSTRLSLDSAREQAKTARSTYLSMLAADLTRRAPEAVWFGVDDVHEVLTITPAAAELLLEHLSTPIAEATS